MTTPESTGGPAGGIKPLRPLFAWALLGYAALSLFFTFLAWVIPVGSGDSFTQRSYFADFADLITVGMPLLAVLIATHVAPMLAGSKLMTLVALVEYAVMLFFGVLVFLVGLGYGFQNVDTASETVTALSHIVFRLAGLGFAALAAYAVLRVFTGLGGRLPIALGRPPSQT